jgi:hypothetical protein
MPDDIGPGRGHEGQQMTGPHAEVDPVGTPRSARPLEDPSRLAGSDEALFVLVHRQGSGPAVEELDGGGARAPPGTRSEARWP